MRPRESKSVTFNEADNTKVEYENPENENHESKNIHNNEDSGLSFFSKLKLKVGGSIPLDDIMNNTNSSDDDGEGKEIMQMQVQEISNFAGSRETRETRETREAGEMREMREMQKYVNLDKKIQGIQNDMNEIKKNQELILSLLEKKMH
jgi:hypothetical protein